MVSVDEARRLTERIRLTAHSARESIEKLHTLVDEAKAGNVHLALGYPSWTAYLSEVLGEEPLRLARDQRQELVGFLAGEGMSTRAIAPIVGTSHMTVQNDLSGVKNFTADDQTEPEAADEFDGGDWVEPEGDEPIEAKIVEDEPARVTGMDGKSYPKPAPAAPRATPRRPLTDAARDAGQELRKAIERLERLTADDRFNRNKNEVAAHLRHHLVHAIKVCQDLSESLSD